MNASLQTEIVLWQRVSKMGEMVPSSQTGASAQIGTNICTIYNLEGVKHVFTKGVCKFLRIMASVEKYLLWLRFDIEYNRRPLIIQVRLFLK